MRRGRRCAREGDIGISSETSARESRSSAINATPALRAKKGLWIKDKNQVLYIKELLPNGVARSVEIYQLDERGRLVSTLAAQSAIPNSELREDISHMSIDGVATNHQPIGDLSIGFSY